MVRPPAPEMSPEKAETAPVKVRVLDPNATLPLPDSVTIEAPAVVPEMSKVPSSATPEDWATEPVPESFRSALPSMVVAPV